MELEARRKEALTKLKGNDDDWECDDLYINAIKAKLAVLD